MVRSLAALALTLALLPGCGPPKEPETPEGVEQEDTPSDQGTAEKKPSTDEGSDEAEAKPDEAAAEVKPAEPAKEASEAETLARDIVKGGGRRIGWSSSKKLFAVPREQRTETSFSIDVLFVGEDGQSRDPMQICQMGDCAERLDELLKEKLPKLAQKLEDGEFIAIRGIGWPDNRDELPVSSLGMKLRWSKGKIEGEKEGKKPVAFNAVGGRLDITALKAIFLVPDSKLLGVFGTPAKMPGVVQTFHVVKMP